MLKSENKGVKANILLMMSGSIACAKASSLISEWSKRGCRVRVACTRSVAEFVGPATLQGLGAEMVFDNVFTPGQAMEHISLGKWADVVIVAPATSNLINKLAMGIADDAVSTVWQAAYGQGNSMFIVPAMNTRMWRYPATQQSITRLKEWGIHVLPVGNGDLACGEQGEGRMLEPATILQMVDHLGGFAAKLPGKRILVTAGGTRERIDSVRYIGNSSTGRTASRLADELTLAGHQVTWLGAEDAVRPVLASKLESYYGFTDLETRLQDLLGQGTFDAVIHAAAVSDFRVDSVENENGEKLSSQKGKLSSDSNVLLRLKRNPKLLNQLKSWSANPNLQVIGFKLTDTDNKHQRIEAVKRQFGQSGVDAVVLNDLSEIGEDAHPFYLHAPAQEPVYCSDGEELATSINRLMEKLV
jgi:phosphopantothenoylcysteine decarboxylase/phosphopantothenate--cysteine ligase